MKNDESLHSLAQRVRNGDPTAARDLREALKSPLARIVRRALRVETIPDPVVCKIRAQVGHPLDREAEPTPAEELALARDLSASMINRLRRSPAARNYARETVVA